LSNHYNATRTEYYINLDSARKKNDISDFIAYATQGFRDGLIEQLTYIFAQIIDISWETFVYEIFKEHKRSERPAKRMRNLVIELSRQSEDVPRDKLIMLSPKLMELYRGGSTMMLTRDINELIKLDLIEKTKKGYRAKTEKMHSFLPEQVAGNKS